LNRWCRNLDCIAHMQGGEMLAATDDTVFISQIEVGVS